jgi:hypothetical protein
MRGRVPFQVAGREYALHFTINRICQLEEDSGKSILELARALDGGRDIRFTDLRMMLRAGLTTEVSLAEAGDMVEEIGVNQALALITKAFSDAFDAKDGGEAKGRGKK